MRVLGLFYGAKRRTVCESTLCRHRQLDSIVNMRLNVYRCGALCLFAAACLLTAAAVEPATVADLRRAFERPPDDARMMVRWWWYGPSVTKPELEREMLSMKQGGIGGFEVQATYPLTVDDPQHGLRNFPYLSDEFLDD